MKNIMELFDEHEEYPSSIYDKEILPMGKLYSYISHTFLLGFINQVLRDSCFKAILVNRYFDEDDAKDLGMSKRESLDALMSESRYHTKLHELRDDVAFLLEQNGIYWFFYFDWDVSDCMIGRFRSDLNFDEVYALMCRFVEDENFVNGYQPIDKEPYWELPNTLFRGWLTW